MSGSTGRSGRRAAGEVCHFRAFLPKVANRFRLSLMSTMNISLPGALKAFVNEQATEHGRDREPCSLRRLLLEGATSPPGSHADAAYFDGWRRSLGGCRGR